MPDLFEEEPNVAAPAGGKLIAVVGTPADGDVVTWVDANSQYEPAAPGGGGGDLDDLNDVDTSGVSDGDVLTYDNGSSTWVAAAPGGSGSADVTPDRPPASPNAADDEFDQADGTAVDTAGTRRSGATAWTEYNKGAATIEQRRGALIITVPSDTDLMDPRGVTQPLPAGDSLYEARVMFSPSATTGWANYQGAGLGFKESSTSKMLLLTIGLDAAAVVYQVRKMTAAQTWLNNQYSSGTNVHQFLWSYFRIARSGTNLLFSISLDLGHSYFQVLSTAQASHFTTAPDEVFLFANARNGTATTATIPWFRRLS